MYDPALCVSMTVQLIVFPVSLTFQNIPIINAPIGTKPIITSPLFQATMGWFAQSLFALTLSSLSLSLVAIIPVALSITLSPALWVVPAVITFTFIYHIYILFLGNSETYTSQRIYSSYSMSCAFVLAFLWTATLAASITLCYLLFSGIIQSTKETINIWVSTLTGISFFETIIMVVIAIFSQKEWKKIKYSEKWRFQTDVKGISNTSQWR